MDKESFYNKYCLLCGSQRCEGIDSEWFNGCSKRDELTDTTNESDSE